MRHSLIVRRLVILATAIGSMACVPTQRSSDVPKIVATFGWNYSYSSARRTVSREMCPGVARVTYVDVSPIVLRRIAMLAEDSGFFSLPESPDFPTRSSLTDGGDPIVSHLPKEIVDLLPTPESVSPCSSSSLEITDGGKKNRIYWSCRDDVKRRPEIAALQTLEDELGPYVARLPPTKCMYH
jgi:hypothetical protein